MDLRSALVALGLTTLLAGACASEEYQPTGDERADDRGECNGADAEYADWLDSYKQSDAFRSALAGTVDEALLAAEAADKPCVQSDDSFLGWFRLWVPLWNQSLDPRANDFAMDAVERAGLEALLLAKPNGSGGAGYGVWLEQYEPALSISLRPILNESNTAVLEEANTINADEDAALALLERAQPTTRGRGAYASWIEVYDEFMTKAIDPLSGKAIEDAEAVYLDRVVARQPGVSADIAYLSWLQLFEDRFASAASVTGDEAQALSDAELAILDRYQSIRAPGVDERPYLAWFGEFTSTFSAVVNNSTGGVTSVGRSHLEDWLAAQPCGQSDAIAEAWARLEAAKDRVDAEVAELIGEAEPFSCE